VQTRVDLQEAGDDGFLRVIPCASVRVRPRDAVLLGAVVVALMLLWVLRNTPEIPLPKDARFIGATVYGESGEEYRVYTSSSDYASALSQCATLLRRASFVDGGGNKREQLWHRQYGQGICTINESVAIERGSLSRLGSPESPWPKVDDLGGGVVIVILRKKVYFDLDPRL
jgi:hypothetical protein